MRQAETFHPGRLDRADRALWIDLVRSSDWPSPLLHPDFARLVASCRSDVRIVRAEDRFGRRAFLPIHKRPLGLARPIGSTFSDYHALIAEPGFDGTIEHVLGTAGLRGFRYFNLIEPGGGDLYGHRYRFSSGTDPLADLKDCHPRRAKTFRRLKRKLEREHGDVALVLDDRSQGAFDTLLDWKDRQFARSGRHNVLKTRWTRQMLGLLRKGGVGDISPFQMTLTVAGRPVASEFGLSWNGIFHPWIAAFDPAFEPYSPGHLLVCEFLEALPASPFAVYDLGSGDEPHKSLFANETIGLSSGRAFAARPRLAPGLFQPGTGGLAGKVVRRWEQILLSETGLPGRIGGAAQAARGLITRKG
ncbi:GNAT family N-acetyltransferase [Hyphobacterium marinum]|uniref:GNAT family N-acetyltransferase n=1 Tax=Hyphobacterium marinum TaxID=3116574 RepID=A0ABU7LVQ4_9PROT|nr:GNAT family N-acetyltransferase [Hyphobacterium sp. Y6023]MEE2565255.1 GNAT family N-acetyltransferase [Hyphobacterium sp. Y6023]